MERRAGVYCRISDDRAGAGLGVARQEEDCRNLCEQRGWSIADVFVDNDISAYKGKPRPQYRRMLDALNSGTIDAVVAWHPDRLHRSTSELDSFIKVVQSAKAQVATVSAGELDLSTASGLMTARVVGAVARYESEHKAERIRRKHVELAQQGRSPGGGTRPFGWEDDRLTLRPDEAERLREAAQRLLAGETLRGIVADWNGQGVATSTGVPWTTTVLRRAVTSWRACGVRSLHDEPIASAVWEPVLDRATVERLRRLLLDPNRRVSVHPRRYLLTGIARCALCDATLVARPRDDKRRCYVCASGPNFHGCGKIRVLADPLEELIVDAVFLRLDSPDLAASVIDRAGTGGDGIAASIEADESMLEELALDWADRRISRAEWIKARERVEKRLTAARTALSRASSTTALDGYVGSSDVLKKAWADMNFDRRRAVIAAITETVTVGPAVRGRNRFDDDRIDVKWKV